MCKITSCIHFTTEVQKQHTVMPEIIKKLAHLSMEDVMPVIMLFRSIYPISVESEHFLKDHIFKIRLSKGKNLHKAGDICNNLYFLVQGAMRCFIKEGTRDSTTWITVEGELVAPIYSFINQVPTFENVQAIEECDLLGMSHLNLQKMYSLFPEFNIVARVIFEKYYSDAEIRALIPRLKNAEIKYEYFLSTYNHLSNRIQLKYIASFLGIKLETLSRVRALKTKKPV